MKKVLVIAIALGLLVGCSRSYQIKVESDKFKGSDLLVLEMWHTVVDGDLDNTSLVYKREVKKGKFLPTIADFTFQSGRMSFGGDQGGDLEKKAYIMAGDKKFEMALSNTKSKENVDLYASGNSYGSSDSYNVNVHAQNWKVLKCTLALTPEIENAIVNCDNYMLRFYYGGRATTLQATPDQLVKLKELLNLKLTDLVFK